MQTISGFFGVLAYVIGALAGNFALIYAGVAIVFLFSVIPILFVSEPRELMGAPEQKRGAPGGAKGGGTQWGQLWRLYAAHAFSWIGVQTMFVYIIAFIQQKMALPAAAGDAARVSGQVISISFAVLNTVGFLLPATVLEPLAKRFGRVRIHAAAVAIMAAGYFGVVIGGTSPLALYILMGVLGVGWASIVSLPFAIMTEKVDKSRTGFFMGIFNLSVVLPQLFVSLVLGKIVLDAPDKSVIFIISGCTLALSALLWIFVHEGKSAASPGPGLEGGK
jgi:MFS family permease